MPQASNVTSVGPLDPIGFGAVGASIGFYGATPVVQPASPAGNVHTVTAGSTTTVYVNTSFDGGLGTTAYTLGDIVAAMKNMGLLAL